MRTDRTIRLWPRFAGLVGVALAVLVASSSAQAQIVYNTTQWDEGAVASTAAAIAKFDSELPSPAGFGCTLLSSTDGPSNQTVFFGPMNDVATHESVVFTVAAADVGTWNFRWGGDYGGGATLVVDGTPLQEIWDDIFWSYGDDFAPPYQFLTG